MRWRIFQGSQRRVLDPLRYDLVIKIAWFRWRYIRDYWEGNVVGMYREMYASKVPEARQLYWENVWLGLKRALWQTFGGVADNWRERRYYKRCAPVQRALLKPTYFSLFGFVNVQKRGIPSRDADVCRPMRKVIGRGVALDGHHWDSPHNFDVSSGCLQVLDYGSLVTQRILDKHAAALSKLTFPQ